MPSPATGPRLLLAALVAAAAAAPGCGLSGGRLAIVEDNDVFNLGGGLRIDRDYSQGAMFAVTLPDADTPDWARDFAAAVPVFADEARFHLALVKLNLISFERFLSR